MKIQVKSDGHNFSIPISTGLIFSKPSVWLYLKLARKYAPHAKAYLPEGMDISVDVFPMQIPDEAVYALCAEIMRIKRIHGSWPLVDLKSASGEEVHIRL